VREIDYLLLVDDEARQGALRFAEKEGGPFLADQDPRKIPPLIELPRLLSAAEHVMADKASDEDLRLLLAPGSSLGGARPKASVRDKDGVSPCPSFFKHRSSAGRLAVTPDSPSSLKMVLHPAFFNAASCRAGVWSSVETRA
jgi:hypothetical protein